MNLLLRSQLRFLRRAPWSAATALAGVALGVASVVAVHLISVQVQRSLDEAAPPHLAGLTHVLSRAKLDADAYFELRDWWRAHPDSAIEALVPLVEGHVTLHGNHVLVVGADWLAAAPADGAAGAQRRLAVGEATPDRTSPSPAGNRSAAGTVTVSRDVLLGLAVLASPDLGVRRGEGIELGGRTYPVADLLDGGLGPALVMDIAAAHDVLGLAPEAVTRVGLRLADPWRPWRQRVDRLMPGFGAGLPAPRAAGLDELVGQPPDLPPGWQALPLAAERPSAAFARSVLFNLGALGTLALLVSWFLVFQVGVIWLRRQQPVLLRLYQLGAPVSRLRSSYLMSFTGLGAAATLVGIGIGVGLASGLSGMASEALAVSVADNATAALDPWLLLKAAASGLGVCLLGGLAAFARAWRREPARSRGRWLLAPLLAGLLAAGVLVERSGVLGGFVAILALSLMGTALVGPVLDGLRRAASHQRGRFPDRRGRFPNRRGRLLDRMALREVVWYPGVLNVALAALALAVATGIGVGLMVESFRADFSRMLSVRLDGDLYVRATAQVADWLQTRPGVTGVRRFGQVRHRVAGRPVELGYGRFDAQECARYGHDRALGPGEALVSEGLARAAGVGVGAPLSADGRTLTVVGLFPGFGEPRGRVLVDLSSLERLGLTPRYSRITVTADDPVLLTDALRQRFPGVDVESRRGLRQRALEIFDRTFAITRALTVLALVVAAVGTYNALTGLRLQQAASRRLLEVQGVGPAALRRIGVIRALAVGGVAVALALPLGIAMAWILCAVINPRSFGWTVDLQLPAGGWLPPLLLGLGAALLAGVLPAPREGGDLQEEG